MYGPSSGPASCEPPSGPSCTIAPVTPGTSETSTRSASRYSASKGSSHDDVFAIVCSVWEFSASPTEPRRPGEQPRAEDHEHGDAVRVGGEEDRAEERERCDDDDRRGQAKAGADGVGRPPVADHARHHDAARVDDQDVHAGYRRGGEEAARQILAAAERPHDERLQQPALGVAAHRPDREEDGEHDAEEQRPEHREAEDRRARERARVEPELVAAEVVHVLEQLARAPRVEHAEREREADHHGEDPAPERLAERVAGDDEDVAHAAVRSSPADSSVVSTAAR